MNFLGILHSSFSSFEKITAWLYIDDVLKTISILNSSVGVSALVSIVDIYTKNTLSNTDTFRSSSVRLRCKFWVWLLLKSSK